ncbi:MAG: integrin alpha [Ferruginibacter sp.]
MSGLLDGARALFWHGYQKDTRFGVRTINPAPTNAQSGGGFGDNMGKIIVALGDIDSDGVGDIGVGVPNSDVGSMDRGELKLISGASKMPIGVLAGPMVGGLRFGSAAAGAGDLNNDDRSEIVVGVPGDGSNLGSVQVFDRSRPGLAPGDLARHGG